eukprot:scaffold96978_cov21-Prasinocladus_malaysianus.AAC.1
MCGGLSSVDSFQGFYGSSRAVSICPVFQAGCPSRAWPRRESSGPEQTVITSGAYAGCRGSGRPAGSRTRTSAGPRSWQPRGSQSTPCTCSAASGASSAACGRPTTPSPTSKPSSHASEPPAAATAALPPQTPLAMT